MKILILSGSFATIALFFWVTGCSRHNEAGHGDEAHSCAIHSVEEAEQATKGQSEHGEEDEVELTPEAIKMAQISLAQIATGKIAESIRLSGEVGFNEERHIHITPRYSGVIVEAKFVVGDFVKASETVATIESNESMAPYALKSTISGTVIEKHATQGEHVSETESIYIISDLTSVWVNLAVYSKDARSVKIGQKVQISAVGANTTAEGNIYFITPVMDPLTRKITARVVLSNNDNQWRPGSFVNAVVEIGETEETLVVEKEAVQFFENKSVVFISDEPNKFRPIEVVTGKSDSRYIQILSGLEAGIQYVNQGAFEIKAKIVTSSLGDHAGHGH